MALQSHQREQSFAPGYEPSAPPLHSASSPYSDPEYARYAPPPPSRSSHSGASRPPLDQSLGAHVMQIASGMVQGAWKHSNTILRIDLRQAVSYRPPTRRRRAVRRDLLRSPALPGASVSSGGPLYGGEGNGYGYDAAVDDEYVAKDESLFGSIRGGGARVKLMQVWDFPHREEGEEKTPWDVNFGFGANVVMDQGRVEPKFRLRAQHVALHLLPEPALEMRGKWPLGDTNLAVYARYRVPISGLGRFWESTEARLMINLYHPHGTGVHLTPQGVQFDDHVFHIAQFTTMRVAAAVDFPHSFPLQEGEQPFGLRLTRLGLKSVIF
ncbi:uncharacterized protein [Physcomitrium patens]|uniref:Uncharacterized protein n=1 Tax=Physcomitrium patens TaxID=3218 RepID=A9TN67_PHYPA|nr:uncharacterized protein LOC112283234 [Physcomitrium patens]PNR52333.1 hypothetical protein PHYPA_008707 [Physcomitrium patens]|eukprot:XP_024377466.1 uncharacterized protein LOC112283234 [Physcomitrella patens]